MFCHGCIPLSWRIAVCGLVVDHPSIGDFLRDGFALKSQLAEFLQIGQSSLEARLPCSTEALAALHPGAFACKAEALVKEVESFYETEVGDGHLYELAAWHLNSAAYIADTLRLQTLIAKGQHLDFGGGIGSHALAAAQLPQVEQVWMVDLNGWNRDFVCQRAQSLGLAHKLRCVRDLTAPELPEQFDSLVCLDVLEHLPDPALQLELFAKRLKAKTGAALMNWYFFKGFNGEYPFHFDGPELVEKFFQTLQDLYLEQFHPYLITARIYGLR